MALMYDASFDSQTRVLSLLDKAGNVISSCEVPPKTMEDDETKPLTFIAKADNSSVTLNDNGSSPTFEISTDGGTTWSEYTLGTPIPLNNRDTVSFRRTGVSVWTSVGAKFAMTGLVEAWHNANSLLGGNLSDSSARVPSMESLFYGCSSLVKAPMLPATSLNRRCYSSMFRGCTNLTQAPALPATVLAYGCYSYMFMGCTNLTQAPALTATRLDGECYSRMFHGCTNLKQAPALPATTISSSSYGSMFEGCTSLEQAPELPATTIYGGGYSHMFSGCTSLKQAPELPATTLNGNQCYGCMFENCTSLTKSPVLPATVLSTGCYIQMFKGCSLLNEVYVKAPSSNSGSFSEWLKNAAPTGNIYADPSLPLPRDTVSGVPDGWGRWVYGAEDTGTTVTMYREGVAKTFKVGSSPYGECYSDEGWAGFKTLSQMHEDGYTFVNRVQTSLYEFTDIITAYSVPANADDGFTETMYDVGDGAGYLTLAQQSENGYFANSTPFTGLTLTATMDNSSVRLVKRGVVSNKYRVNVGNGWQDYTDSTIPLNSGSSCKWRRSLFVHNQDSSNYVGFSLGGEIEASGSVMSMVDGTGLTTSLDGYPYALRYLFSNCQNLTQAPELPATVLSLGCYSSMFYFCKKLTQAPSLPATTLADGCYLNMFQDCTSLTQAPALPATVLTSQCYRGMFVGCTSLSKTPDLPATTLEVYCYNSMFKGCSALTEVRIRATTTAGAALDQWLNNVSASGTVYADPSFTGLPTDSASGVPSGWTRLNINDYPNP